MYVFLWFEIFTISHAKQNVPSLEHNIVGRKKYHMTGCSGRIVIFYIYKNEAEEYFLNMLSVEKQWDIQSHCLDSKQVSLMSWLWCESCKAPFSGVFKSSGCDEFCIGYLRDWLKLSHRGFVPRLMLTATNRRYPLEHPACSQRAALSLSA